VEDEENASKLDGQDLQYVVLDLGGMSLYHFRFFFSTQVQSTGDTCLNIAGVTSIDNTGIGMLVEVHKSLDRKGIRVITSSIPNQCLNFNH
jgi:sulfate transporter 3